MSATTKIQWCDATFNPWIGCTKISPGCANCYAEKSTPSRTMDIAWGKGQPRRRTRPATWRQPGQWNRYLQCDCGTIKIEPDAKAARKFLCPVCRSAFRRPRVFCGSLCDWLDDEVPIEWLADLLDLIRRTPNLDWLLLTKRPENWKPRLKACTARGLPSVNLADVWLDGTAPPNVWIGVSAEDQERWWDRQGALVNIPAAKRFVSAEPMLGPIDFELRHGCRACNHPGNIVIAWNQHGRCSQCDGTGHEPSGIDWIIFGGESDKKAARRCDVNWIYDGLRQCREAGVAAFVKQLGSQPMRGYDLSKPGQGPFANAIGDHWTLDHSKGGDPWEWPSDLQVRQFPP